MEPLVTAPPLVVACPQLWSLGWMSHPFRRVARAFDRLAQFALKKFWPVHNFGRSAGRAIPFAESRTLSIDSRSLH